MIVLLRLVTLCWEFGAGLVRCPPPAAYALWCLLPFTTIGPILRYSELEPQLPWNVARHPAATIVRWDWVRTVLAAALAMGFGAVLSATPRSTLLALAPGRPWLVTAAHVLFIAPWSFYLFNAGLCRLMECFALFWGLKLPPSFQRPFGRPNLAEFWATWNMTVMRVFRDYLFYLRTWRGKPNRYLNASLIFVLSGVWHGFNAYWLLWGVMHAIGFCTFLAYRDWRHGRPGRNGAWLAVPSRLLRPASGALTYLYVCACWAVPGKLIELLSE